MADSNSQLIARKEVKYGRMCEQDRRQLTQEMQVAFRQYHVDPICTDAPRSNVLAQLRFSDNIVKYCGHIFDSHNDILYIAMEYCSGGDLSDVVKQRRETRWAVAFLSPEAQLSSTFSRTFIREAKVWTYLSEITSALAECHSELDRAGARKPIILHRDIKPENGVCPSIDGELGERYCSDKELCA